MIAAHVLACIAFGAVWRLLKGGTLRSGTAQIAAWTFVPMCALPLLPLWSILDPGKWMLALLGVGCVSAAFLLVRADNGGNSHPLMRFLFFGGLGYWWADRYKPEWHALVGELWLGGAWFGFLAASAALLAWGVR